MGLHELAVDAVRAHCPDAVEIHVNRVELDHDEARVHVTARQPPQRDAIEISLVKTVESR